MLSPQHINPIERQFIAEVEQNEAWLLAERLGRPVDPKSPEVRSRVIEIVLRCGQQWRREIEMRFGVTRKQ